MERVPYPAYDSRKEKRIEEVPLRNERVHYPPADSQKRNERRADYSEQKYDRNIGKYNQSPVEVQYKHHVPEKKGFYDNKNYPKYKEKQIEPSYNAKQNYPRREQNFQEKKIRYDERADLYPPDNRKQRTYPKRHDNRLPQTHHSNPDRHVTDQKQGDMRIMKERQPEWQPDRIKKHKDSAPGYSGGMQRISPWVDGRDGSKLRVDTRGPQPGRNNRDPHANRGDTYRQGRTEQRDPIRPAPRDHHPGRAITRKPEHEKWGAERVQYDDNRSRFTDDRGRSAENTRLPEEQASPTFFREVRRSGETRHHDLGIEITIRDDRGRASGELEKNRFVELRRGRD